MTDWAGLDAEFEDLGEALRGVLDAPVSNAGVRRLCRTLEALSGDAAGRLDVASRAAVRTSIEDALDRLRDTGDGDGSLGQLIARAIRRLTELEQAIRPEGGSPDTAMAPTAGMRSSRLDAHGTMTKEARP
jgi:hypothetical protein